MPTNNERTVPSPERDELEKFIEKQIAGDEDLPWFVVEDICKNVAAFSARRAREKAIEECQEKIRSDYEEVCDPTGLVKACCLLEELKSQAK